MRRGKGSDTAVAQRRGGGTAISAERQKLLGQYSTPRRVVAPLIRWLVRTPEDEFLDPSCGDGRFLELHQRATGVDACGDNCRRARAAAPWARVHRADFFHWATSTAERFDAVGGNPPFIRYQRFTGDTRAAALAIAASMGARLSGLTSSWAPFILAAASLLKPGGRLAFVVPAEIGHATYAKPLVEALCRHFEDVLVTAVREKLFPRLSEDVWLLYASGYGGDTKEVGLVVRDVFAPDEGCPEPDRRIPLSRWRAHSGRLRKFILPPSVLQLYEDAQSLPGTRRLGDLARTGVGYVTGANDFFHLTPSQVEFLGIPRSLTRVAVRKGEQLPDETVDRRAVREWLARDMAVLLLDLTGVNALPKAVREYLDSPQGQKARETYKCRMRDPWYVVPGIVAPDGFLTYMSGAEPALVWNDAGCVCTNSIHAVRLHRGLQETVSPRALQEAWSHPLSRLSQELEGHPLGGGMLKLEPREASKVLISVEPAEQIETSRALVMEGIEVARRWRHAI